MAQTHEWLELQERLFAMRNEAARRLAQAGGSQSRLDHQHSGPATATPSGDDAYLRQLDHAISRIELGLYPSCERCGVRIEMDRLREMPHATTCRSCAEAERTAPV